MTDKNIYLSGSIPWLFAKTAAPIVLIMVVNALFTIVDAYFLGAYVGPDALTAVTLMFPLYMFLIALSTLVSTGFSSIYARMNGAGDTREAGAVFVSALQLALLVCAVLMLLFGLWGWRVAFAAADGAQNLASLGHLYIGILIYGAVLSFVLGIYIDALRCEGALTALAAITLMSALLNIGFDWLFVVKLRFGVAGSAYGTLFSQVVALVAVLLYRKGQITRSLWRFTPTYWASLLALGAPASLGFVGISLLSGTTIYALQLWAGDSYSATTAAYGIYTRMMTFVYLPMLGLALAFQTIVGNNFGAGYTQRVRGTVKVMFVIGLAYSAIYQVLFYSLRDQIGAVFVDDPMIISELARIIRLSTWVMFLFGPLLMVSRYFQAIGDAKRAVILTLTRTYVLAIPLILLLPRFIGEPGIWISGVLAEVTMLILTTVIVRQYLRSRRPAAR